MSVAHVDWKMILVSWKCHGIVTEFDYKVQAEPCFYLFLLFVLSLNKVYKKRNVECCFWLSVKVLQ